MQESRDRIKSEYIAFEENPEEYDIETAPAFCYYMRHGMFYPEALQHNPCYQAEPYTSEYTFFEYWAKGLSGCGMFDYWYFGNAREIVAEILEETEEEKNKYTEEAAADLLTRLIYREMVAGSNKQAF